jgi:hypothetical protein
VEEGRLTNSPSTRGHSATIFPKGIRVASNDLKRDAITRETTEAARDAAETLKDGSTTWTGKGRVVLETEEASGSESSERKEGIEERRCLAGTASRTRATEEVGIRATPGA